MRVLYRIIGVSAAFILLAGLGAALLTLSAVSAQVSDFSTPTPTPVPTAAAGASVQRVPFNETSNVMSDWQPDGAWQYVADASSGGGFGNGGGSGSAETVNAETVNGGATLGGGSWLLDGSLRETVSTLRYTPFIDLSGTQSAQIVFWQRGSLPASDLVVIRLSVDGGATWIPVDWQAGVKTPTDETGQSSWESRTVNLDRFRNQMVRLQVRVQTGVQLGEPPGSQTGTLSQQALSPAFYQIDNISVIFRPVPPEFADFVLEQGPRTLWGLHLIVGANEGPVLDFVQRMQAAGWPVGTVKGTTGTETLLAQVKAASPKTVIVYRALVTQDRGMVDCPNAQADPVAEANAWMAGLWPAWSQVDADYYEFMNECLPPFEWLAPFTIEVMRLAAERNKCVLALSFDGGSPQPSEFPKLLPVFQYALDHPCQPGRHHGIALHVAGGGPHKLLSESDSWWGYRYRRYYAEILPYLPRASRLPVYFTEAGPGDGRVQFSCEEIARDMVQYTQQVQQDGFVRGIHLWSLGGPPDLPWVDVTPCLPVIGDALLRYYNGG